RYALSLSSVMSSPSNSLSPTPRTNRMSPRVRRQFGVSPLVTTRNNNNFGDSTGDTASLPRVRRPQSHGNYHSSVGLEKRRRENQIQKATLRSLERLDSSSTRSLAVEELQHIIARWCSPDSPPRDRDAVLKILLSNRHMSDRCRGATREHIALLGYIVQHHLRVDPTCFDKDSAILGLIVSTLARAVATPSTEDVISQTVVEIWRNITAATPEHNWPVYYQLIVSRLFGPLKADDDGNRQPKLNIQGRRGLFLVIAHFTRALVESITSRPVEEATRPSLLDLHVARIFQLLKESEGTGMGTTRVFAMIPACNVGVHSRWIQGHIPRQAA
ncbi:hypothetical protein FOZ63_027722, partial [Perkinsus olseni]